MLRLSFVLVLAALITPVVALGHGNWFATAAGTAQDVEAKYSAVAAANCRALPSWARARFGAQSQIRGTVRTWNHFLCAVYSTWLDDTCLAVAHHVGQDRDGVNLTSWPYGNGCTTRALWG